MRTFFRQHFWVSLITITVVGLSIYIGLSSLLAPKRTGPVIITENSATVTRVDPHPNSPSIGPVPDLVVEFDIDVKAENINLRSIPSISFDKSNQTKRKVLFRPKESLNPNQEYVFTVVVLEDNEKFSWKITTKSFSVAKDYADKVNNVKKALPYQGNGFRVVYDPPTDKYFADISGEPMSRYVADVQAWFATFGITDTSALNLVPFPTRKF